MRFLVDDDANPSEPLTAGLTPVFQALGVVGGIVIVLAAVLLVMRFLRLRGGGTFPKPLTVGAVVAGCLGVIALVMAIGAGVVVA